MIYFEGVSVFDFRYLTPLQALGDNIYKFLVAIHLKKKSEFWTPSTSRMSDKWLLTYNNLYNVKLRICSPWCIICHSEPSCCKTQEPVSFICLFWYPLFNFSLPPPPTFPVLWWSLPLIHTCYVCMYIYMYFDFHLWERTWNIHDFLWTSTFNIKFSSSFHFAFQHFICQHFSLFV